MVRSAPSFFLRRRLCASIVRVCRIIRRRRPRRWMSSSTRHPAILTHLGGIVATHHIDKSTAVEVINPNQ
jgi:hypothetical protein